MTVKSKTFIPLKAVLLDAGFVEYVNDESGIGAVFESVNTAVCAMRAEACIAPDWKAKVVANRKANNLKRKLCEENGIKLFYYSIEKIENPPYEIYNNIDDLFKQILND